MFKRLLFLINLILFLNLTVFADDLYYVGFLGNSENASTDSLLTGLEVSLNIEDENYVNGRIKPVFFDENSENVISDIKDTQNLLAIIGCFNEKHKKIIEAINDVPLISISKDFIDFNYLNKPNVFRICPSEVQLARDLARFAVAILDKRHYAVVYTDGVTDFLKAAEEFSETVKRNGAKVDYFRSVEPQRKDFTNILLRLRDLKVQAIFFIGTLEQSINFAKQSYEMKTGALFMSTNTIGNRLFIKKLQNEAEKSCYADISPDNLYKLKKFRPFLTEYYKTNKNIDKHLAYLYDAATIVKLCYNKNLKDKDNLLNCFKETFYDGITGQINFNDYGLRKTVNSFFYIIVKREILYRKLTDQEYKKFMEAK
ncbi:MAG: ABC transporter substrate-binding protein [Candidatus Goldbacteria bacterium]|nr:ABC transporter substrate-binding protein [Candidatus Goldiibacteriota bacterium]